MKKNISTYFLLFLVILSFYFSACGSDTPAGSTPLVDSSSFTYPYTVGSTWNYKRIFSVENIRPDSIRHYFTNWPFYATGSVTILYDTVINGNSARCFLEKYTEIQNDTITWESRFYYGNYDTALVGFGYRSNGGIVGMPYSSQAGIKYEKYGKTFSNIKQVFNFVENGYYTNSVSDSFYTEVPPVISLKYPVVTGTEWVSKYIQGTPWSYKKYLSFNIEYAGAIPVSCIKTERRIPSFGDDIFFYDYYSKYGQVKRDYLVKNMLVSTIHNPDGVGYVDMRDVYSVTSFNIITP